MRTHSFSWRKRLFTFFAASTGAANGVSKLPAMGASGSASNTTGNDVTPEAYRSFGFPGAEDLGNMFQIKRDFEAAYCGNRDIPLARSLNPALQSFDAWLAANHDRIPVA